ncbi:MAG: Flp pilus assembly complex ATPase component TadA [Deltaproteobacteria bacterium]|nr:Flp pilus assembly complex ATPase component TadA [Deltaproteobacteria bacterium]
MSTNGTCVNGKKIQKIPLKLKDKIQISDFTLQMKSELSTQSPQEKITEELKKKLENTETILMAPETLKERLSTQMEELMIQNSLNFENPLEKNSYISSQLEKILGLDFLETYIKDPEISEIMINGPKTIYIERNGQIERAKDFFESETMLSTIIDRILAPLGRHVDEASPLVDARLPDGSRINVVLSPISLQGPILTIRKFKSCFQTLENLIQAGSLTPEAAAYLQNFIHEKKNILISGGTSSGKTTLLNVLSNCIDPLERLITIEDSAELKLTQSHTLSLEARPSNVEGKGEISIRTLVQNALRMRPDRLIIGECRGSEALDMLQAMNTGHEGCLTTCHANSPRDALKRLETMVLMSGFELPLRAIREQIASAIHVIVQMKRLAQGLRTVTHITRVCGLEQETILTQDLFNSTKGDSHDTQLKINEL